MKEYTSPANVHKNTELAHQDAILAKEDLKALKGLNSFTDDILNQHFQGTILTDKQINALRSQKKKAIENHGSLENFIEQRELEDQLEYLCSYIKRKEIHNNFWKGDEEHDGHRKVFLQMLNQLKTRSRPSLSEKQRDYLLQILDNYQKKLRKHFLENPGQIPESYNERILEILKHEEGYVLMRRTYEYGAGFGYKRWNEFTYQTYWETKEEAVQAAEDIHEKYGHESQYLAVDVNHYYNNKGLSRQKKQNWENITEIIEEGIEEMSRYGVLNKKAEEISPEMVEELV